MKKFLIVMLLTALRLNAQEFEIGDDDLYGYDD